jgi:hypothetical protein
MGISSINNYIQVMAGEWRLVAGDSDANTVAISFDGTPYTFVTGDKLILTVKASANAETAVLTKEFTDEHVNLVPSDTASITPGDYIYDLKLERDDGIHKTLFSQCKFILAKGLTADE